MVGKTSCLLRYVKKEFIKVQERTVNTSSLTKKLEIDSKVFILNIFDTAGEEKFHALAPLFYRGADGAVIIFDYTRRETFNRAQQWFEELYNFADNNPRTILVGNKCDLSDKQIDQEEANNLAKKYNSNFMEASAFTGYNINEIFLLQLYQIY